MLIPAIADRAALLSHRGSFRAQSGRWKEAATDLVESLNLDASNHNNWYILAPLLVEIGELEEYKKVRSKILQRYGNTTEATIAERTAKVCLMVPSGATDLSNATRLADVAITNGRDAPWAVYFQVVKGFAEYRNGNFSAATNWLEKALAYPAGLNRDMQAYMVLAMSLHQLKQVERARAAFTSGLEIAKRNASRLEHGPINDNWHDWLIAFVLMREARAVIDPDMKVPGIESPKGKLQDSASSRTAKASP